MFSTIYRIQIFLRTRPTLSIWNFKNVEYSQKSEQYLGKSRFCKTKWKCWDCLGKLSNRLGKRAFPKWALDKKGQCPLVDQMLQISNIKHSPTLSTTANLIASSCINIQGKLFFRCWINLCRFARTKQQIFSQSLLQD